MFKKQTSEKQEINVTINFDIFIIIIFIIILYYSWLLPFEIVKK